MHPEFDPTSLDLVTDRFNLRNLLKIVCGNSVRDFRVDIELVGETLLFTCCTGNRSTRYYNYSTNCYGHSFEKALGRYPASLSKAGGHYRIIQYSLAGLRILLRFEADGYLASEDDVPAIPSVVTDSLANSVIQGNKEKGRSSVQVIPAGHQLPHNTLIEMKTSTIKENKWYPLNKCVDQLWFGQIRHLKVGYHSGGIFERIDGREFLEGCEEFERFGRAKAQGFKKMVVLIQNIRKGMEENGLVHAFLRNEADGLKLYKKEGGTHNLPQDLLAKWKSLQASQLQ